MNRVKKNLAEQLMSHRVLVNNCLNDPVIQTVMVRFGYGPDELKIGEGKRLRVEEARTAQSAAYGKQMGATKAVKTAWARAKMRYNDSLALARVAFKTDIRAQTVLRLQGARRRVLAGWLEDAKLFYHQLLADPALAQALRRYGRDETVLKDELALVEQLERLKSAQEYAKGEAQGATEVLDRLIDDNAAWVSDLRAIAKVAFSADKQQLERLGMVVLNKPRAKKKAAQ